MLSRRCTSRAAIALATLGAALALAPTAFGQSFDADPDGANPVIGEPVPEMTAPQPPPMMAPQLSPPTVIEERDPPAPAPAPAPAPVRPSTTAPAASPQPALTPAQEAVKRALARQYYVARQGSGFAFEIYPDVGNYGLTEAGPKPAEKAPAVGDDIAVSLEDLPADLRKQVTEEVTRQNRQDKPVSVDVRLEVTAVEQVSGRTVVRVKVTTIALRYPTPGNRKPGEATLVDIAYASKNIELSLNLAKK